MEADLFADLPAREQKIAAVRRAVNGPIRGAVYRLLSGTALLIGLLQAPGTILDVYPDSRELAHVVSVQIKVITLDLYGGGKRRPWTAEPLLPDRLPGNGDGTYEKPGHVGPSPHVISRRR